MKRLPYTMFGVNFVDLELLLLICAVTATSADPKRPNILLFVADDLGYGDLGCYGNGSVETPNIDSIAAEGVKLTQHLTAASVCTPSRAALLTGRYPVRSGMVSIGAMKVITWMCSSSGLPDSEVTIAELTKQAGYRNGFIGKWHLGDNSDHYGDHKSHPLQQGFDYFYGVLLTNLEDFGETGSRVILNYHPCWYMELVAVWGVGLVTGVSLWRAEHMSLGLLVGLLVLWTAGVGVPYFLMDSMVLLSSMIHKNFEVVEQPIRLAGLSQRLATEGIEFIEDSVKSKQPFLLVMSWIHMHVFIRTAKEFEGRSKFGHYGDALSEMDWSVGEVVQTLRRLDAFDNTLVYFTSDNGGHLELGRDGGYNGHLKGGKTHGAPDGGIRVPGLVQWPRVIPPGTTTDEPTSQMDIFHLVASAAGVPVPRDRQVDGRNILPLLQGGSQVSPHDFLFHYCGNHIHAVRYRPREGTTTWKLVTHEPFFMPGTNLCKFVCDCSSAIRLDIPHLYNLTDDPGEATPVDTDSDTYSELAPLMLAAIEEHKRTVKPVDSQFTFWRLMPRLHWQPCCNGVFPFGCRCTDPKYPN